MCALKLSLHGVGAYLACQLGFPRGNSPKIFYNDYFCCSQPNTYGLGSSVQRFQTNRLYRPKEYDYVDYSQSCYPCRIRYCRSNCRCGPTHAASDASWSDRRFVWSAHTAPDASRSDRRFVWPTHAASDASWSDRRFVWSAHAASDASRSDRRHVWPTHAAPDASRSDRRHVWPTHAASDASRANRCHVWPAHAASDASRSDNGVTKTADSLLDSK